MKRFTIFHAPFFSFFSKDLYRDAAFNWKGTGFAYLLLLLAVCWIPIIAHLNSAMTEFLDGETTEFIKQIPDVTISGGEASINAPEPYPLRDVASGRVVAVIDTTGEFTSPGEIPAQALITKTEAIVKKSQYETRTFSFQDIPDYTLTQETILGWLDTGKSLFWPVMYPSALIGSFIFRVTMALLYAALGLLIAQMLGASLQYKALLRLSVIAFTPVIIVKTALGLLEVAIPWGFLLYLIAALGFLFFGVNAVAQEQNQAPSAPVDWEPPGE